MGKMVPNKTMKCTWKDYMDIFTPSGANQNVLGPIMNFLKVEKVKKSKKSKMCMRVLVLGYENLEFRV